MTLVTSASVDERLARIEARFKDAIPHLATKADLVGLKWAMGFLGLVVLSGFGLPRMLITSVTWCGF